MNASSESLKPQIVFSAYLTNKFIFYISIKATRIAITIKHKPSKFMFERRDFNDACSVKTKFFRSKFERIDVSLFVPVYDSSLQHAHATGSKVMWNNSLMRALPHFLMLLSRLHVVFNWCFHLIFALDALYLDWWFKIDYFSFVMNNICLGSVDT